MNAKTGAILAMATYPGFNPNDPTYIFFEKDRYALAQMSDDKKTEEEIAELEKEYQANISAKSIQTINFVYPTLEEQHRIVRTLDTLSEKCRRLEQVAQQTIRECDALKQSILRQAFSGEL